MVDRHALDVDAGGSSPSAGIARSQDVRGQETFRPEPGGMAPSLEDGDRWFDSSRVDPRSQHWRELA